MGEVEEGGCCKFVLILAYGTMGEAVKTRMRGELTGFCSVVLLSAGKHEVSPMHRTRQQPRSTGKSRYYSHGPDVAALIATPLSALLKGRSDLCGVSTISLKSLLRSAPLWRGRWWVTTLFTSLSCGWQGEGKGRGGKSGESNQGLED